MSVIVDVQDEGAKAIESTNEFFENTGKPFVITRMTEQDLRWCINRSSQSPVPLDWRYVGGDLEREDGYNFCFKLTCEDEEINPLPERPQGGCACSYSQYNSTVTIEMIQNFSLPDSPLDGRMMEYSLITIIFFLGEVNGTGVFIDNPVNDEICDHYIDVYGFSPFDGNRSLLYISADELTEWYGNLGREGTGAS